MEKSDLTGETARELSEVIFEILPQVISEGQGRVWVKEKNKKRLKEALEEGIGKVVV